MSLAFEFECSCEISPAGEIWCCDVCSTTLDLKDELSTEESLRLRGWDDLIDVSYTSIGAALDAGVSEETIHASMDRELEYQATLDALRETEYRESWSPPEISNPLPADYDSIPF